jgi:hypothetical protein
MKMNDVTTLYRPIGQAELDLIRESGFTAFPPRLPEQPIFYPVLTRSYAEQIARDWNTKDPKSGFAGYVVQFQVRTEYLKKFSIQKAGAREHLEYWIPAGQISEFNQNIVGEIEVIAEFRSTNS